MGKSVKKNGYCTYTKKDNSWKKIFNRRLRREPIDIAEGVSALADGGAFKRANETWEISDGGALAPSLDDFWGNEYELFRLYYAK